MIYHPFFWFEREWYNVISLGYPTHITSWSAPYGNEKRIIHIIQNKTNIIVNAQHTGFIRDVYMFYTGYWIHVYLFLNGLKKYE